MKICSQCKARLSPDAFALNKRAKDGRAYACRGCVKTRKAEIKAGLRLPQRGERPERQREPLSAPLALPVALMPAPCKCPKEWHNGILYKAHQVDCRELNLFNRIGPAYAQKAQAEVRYYGLKFGY
jgi:hypothetical protein